MNHTLKIGGEIMADAPTNLMAKYYVQESSGDYSQSVSQSVYLWWKLLEHLLEIEAGGSNSLSQDVDCLMGSYMPCPPYFH